LPSRKTIIRRARNAAPRHSVAGPDGADERRLVVFERGGACQQTVRLKSETRSAEKRDPIG